MFANANKMSEFVSWENYGFRDFFDSQPTSDLVKALAKIISKNMLAPECQSGKMQSFITNHKPIQIQDFVLFSHRCY